LYFGTERRENTERNVAGVDTVAGGVNGVRVELEGVDVVLGDTYAE
jgi:hypothetical protein